jgi:DNA polymerase lambda
MGSYRRGAENSGDVDFLITRDDSDGLDHSGIIERLVRKLMFMGIITHEVSPIKQME